MRLYIMRHGPAESHAASGRDADRQLTAAGRERVRLVSELLARVEGAPGRILASPLLRARQTAEIVQAIAGGGPIELREELGLEGRLLELVEELLRAGAPRALLVGHQPSVEVLAARLATRLPFSGFDKAMVVRVDRSERAWSLGAVLDPKRLTFIEP